MRRNVRPALGKFGQGLLFAATVLASVATRAQSPWDYGPPQYREYVPPQYRAASANMGWAPAPGPTPVPGPTPASTQAPTPAPAHYGSPWDPSCGAFPQNPMPYGGAVAQPGMGCASIAPPMNYACPSPIVWGGRAGALLLFRDDANHEFFSFDSAIETNQLLDARDAVDDFGPGVEAQIVRFNICTMRGVEALYWGVFPTEGSSSVFAGDVTGDLNAILNFDQLDYNGALASAFVNDALVQRVRSESDIHNVEINRLWGFAGGGCSPWTVRGLAGFRFFNFSENFEFAADTVDTMFTGSADELYYTIDVDNYLYGLQLGSYVERASGPWSATFGAKAGVFANDASAVSRIGGAAGTAIVNNGPNIGRPWLVSASKTDVAFIGELRAGGARQLSLHWRATAEYRVMAVSGVALPTNQIFHDLRGLQDVELLATNGTLLLHGAFFGLERTF